MAFLGMDIEGVRALAQQFGEKAQTTANNNADDQEQASGH